MDLNNFAKTCRKIIGIGLNYKKTIAELNISTPQLPVLFLKSTSSIIKEGQVIKIPSGCIDVNYEVELGVIIGQSGADILEENALNHIGGYALILDMTSGSHLSFVREKSLPWCIAKNWDTFCPVSDFIPKEAIKNPDDVNLWLTVDGEMKQSESTSDMLFSVAKLISYTSQVMTLERGDLILTGTPNGVGPVKAGQIIECGIKGIKQMKFSVENK
ncbi:oxaloacetate decarboxylase, mitochondrial-like [Hydra vulgaris]|uniref:oxaloacetate tautomerase n=1 Tax=Hydra vulgaris TaxID=6087 RepID=A0ABM4BXJ9_HYDVU